MRSARVWFGSLGLVALSIAPKVAHADEGRVVVAAKNFTESRVLGEIMAQLLEAHTTLRIERRWNLGGTMVVFSALQNGEVDVYPEYTGTAFAVLLEHEERVTDRLRTFRVAQRDSEARFDLTWLSPFGFNNTYALSMPEARAAELNVRTVSDLLAHQDDLVAGVSHEFLKRPDGFPGLAKAYGLKIGDVRGMEHGLAYEALRAGRVDVIDAYSTDGKLLKFNVRVLEDDRAFFPPYQAAPFIRRATLRAHPEVAEVLERLAWRIDDARMQGLNLAAEEGERSFEVIARDFLRAEGLVGGDASPRVAARGRNAGSAWDFAVSRVGVTLELAAWHLALTGAAVLLAALFALPLGVWLTRRRRFAPPVLAAAGVVQTIPSLALLAFLIPVPFFGLGARTAIAALFVYAVLPMLRNTVTGILEVDPALTDAARGMGLSDRQVLWHVELPLATHTIMAGVRTATVISVGVATLAAFIGAGGLGDPIVTGLQLNDVRLILAGAIPAAALALLVDGALALAERALSPP